jgi:hypothetical protein
MVEVTVTVTTTITIRTATIVKAHDLLSSVDRLLPQRFYPGAQSQASPSVL